METVGQQLQAARVAKKMTLSDAASRTQIKVQQLEALECDDYSAMPAPIYTRGFIKLYAKTVGLDGQALVEQFSAAQAPKQVPDVEVGTEVLDKKPVVEADSEDKEAVITHPKQQRLSPPAPPGNLNRPDWMMLIGRYIPLVGALVVVALLWVGLKSCIGSASSEVGVDPSVFETTSPLIEEPPEPYLNPE